MSAAALLTLMTHLAPYTARAHLAPVAQAIAAVARTPEEAAMLTVVSFTENTFTQGIPWGLSAWHPRYCAPLSDWAATAAQWLQKARKICGTASPAVVLGWFHHGSSCKPDRYSRMQARLVSRLLQPRYARR